MTKIVHEHGGIIDKFIGDAVMVYFGAFDTRSQSENACACVAMAIAMQNRMKELPQKWKSEGINMPFEIRCGINAGYCTIGNFGSDERVDYTIIGSEVNLASRLESNCAPGKVLVSEPVKLLTEEKFKFEEKGEITVKGFVYPVKVFEVHG